MPDYRRVYVPGGTYFFTVVTELRRPLLCRPIVRQYFREAIQQTRRTRPFEVVAWVLLPDHLHCIWRLPDGDSDFSTRWRLIKARATRAIAPYLGTPERNESRQRHQEQAIWQRRFWEHSIRDEADLNRHIAYIHYNPVKHDLVDDVMLWPYSSVHRFGSERPTGDGGFDPVGIEGMECE